MIIRFTAAGEEMAGQVRGVLGDGRLYVVTQYGQWFTVRLEGDRWVNDGEEPEECAGPVTETCQKNDPPQQPRPNQSKQLSL